MICRGCGCSDNVPCIDEFGQPCAWVVGRGALCSFCAEDADQAAGLVQVYSEGEATEFLRGAQC